MQIRRSRTTHQRRAILDVVRGPTSHPSAEDVFFAVKRRVPAISLGTVYRNLRILTEEGEIVELLTADGVRRYDDVIEPHAHVICTGCGLISDVMLPPGAVAEIVRSAERDASYRIQRHTMEMYGLCRSCSEREVTRAMNSERGTGVSVNQQ